MNSILMCALIVSSLVISLTPSLGETNQTNPVAATPTLPIPSGTFGIGRIGYEWIDLSRPVVDPKTETRRRQENGDTDRP
jgi:hypothetical protein